MKNITAYLGAESSDTINNKAIKSNGNVILFLIVSGWQNFQERNVYLKMINRRMIIFMQIMSDYVILFQCHQEKILDIAR